VADDVTLAMGEFQKSLGRAFAAQETLTLRQASSAFKVIGLDVFKRTRADTPVDTGFARAEWRIMVDEDAAGVVIVIWNGAAYILPLEYGSSRQAPEGMLRKNILAAARRLDRARSMLESGGSWGSARSTLRK